MFAICSQKIMALCCPLCVFAPLRLIVFSADAPRQKTQLNAKAQRRKGGNIVP